MQRAYAQDPMNKFIRDIKTAPEPAIVIADDQQLTDIVRFCTSSVEFGVLTIDPTFSLGDFDVTPMTYRYLLLETRRNGQSPIFLGPVLVHFKKTFCSYLFFASSLIGQNRQVEGVRAIGTDGEQPLIDAFLHEFGFAQHLTCFIHVRRNIKDKLSECNIPPELTSTILRDIFGQRLGSTFQEGLVDSTDNDDYENKLENLVQSWINSELPSTADISKFIKWFTTHKAGVIKNSMIRPVREECGLGNPPSSFTTNASESINALLKRKVDYKKQELPAFIDTVKELVHEQRQEVERALVNRGKLRLREQYQTLQVSESDWFTMSAHQRQKHLTKIHTITLSDVHEKTKEITHQYPVSRLPVEANVVAADLNLPITCVEGIWTKAVKLLQEENAIVPAPGQSPEARMVLSYTGKPPHMVTPTKGGGFSCDSNCPNWKSLGVCAHAVAVAQTNGKLEQFVSIVKKKKVPNITALATTTMPRGRGRKGGAPPRKRQPLQPTDTCTRVSMNVGTQVVSDAAVSIGTVVTSPTVNPGHFQYFGASPYNYGYSAPNQYVAQPILRQPCDLWSVCPRPYSYSADSFNPFSLCFVKGNISVCIGCKNRYAKNAQPPDDLCIKHQEWREFTPAGNDTPQSKFSNVYYHCRPQCVWLRCSDFQPSHVDSTAVYDQLTAVHKEHLALHFQIYLD